MPLRIEKITRTQATARCIRKTKAVQETKKYGTEIKTLVQEKQCKWFASWMQNVDFLALALHSKYARDNAEPDLHSSL
jgi:hypothetical protein